MEAKKQEEYCADLYLRLSREDGDKAESDSIANQRELLMDYLSSHPEIRLHEVRTDDGCKIAFISLDKASVVKV